MIQTHFAIILSGISSFLFAQDFSYHLDPVARLTFSSVVYSVGDTAGGSDCWGYVDRKGNDYAIMGILDGTAIVRVNDLKVIATVPGPMERDPYFHRDMMTYGDYLYICHEMTGTNEGIQIIDLSTLPDSIRYVDTINRSDAGGQSANTSHNLFVDESTGMLYTVRKYANGVRLLSLKDPEKPQDVGIIETPDAHDVFSRNDTVFVAEGWNGSFSIWDAKEMKSSPSLLARVGIPSGGYVHTVWTTADGNYLMTAEETSRRTMKIWDITNFDDIEMVGEYLGSSNLAHNIHIKHNLAFVSHYSSGAIVVDISDPANPVEVANFDTYTASDESTYLGAWGIYPFSPNGYVYVSNAEGHLDILRFREESLSIHMSSETFPERISLGNNFPNPFNGETSISVSISSEREVSLEVFNALGIRVATVFNGSLPAGDYSFRWQSGGMPSGIYFARLSSSSIVQSVKMLHLK
ncbi:MAG: hypothetical protein CMG71_06625 [Candidatus Marinimicrobia bacterium]|nr:hypothetical protein [Candidatus Neomarinimicrobiota bacterium]|tara:strand:+ start:17734 stop:19128 length:1395 start_codon:yes stop_codon:yes gene_type:complete